MNLTTFTLENAARHLGLLAAVCMDCGCHYRTVSAEGGAGGISHGLCIACSDVRETEDAIRDYYEQKRIESNAAWKKVREAQEAGAPSSVVEDLKRRAIRAGYTGD